VDLIILAVDDSRGQGLAPSWISAAAAWANESRAPVLAIDPPPQGSGVNTKLSLVGALPLAHSAVNGKIYLCNLGIPVNMYQELGIAYNSPFGPKFVIPLHPNS
jgi:enhancer of mRNA-decapping protein 3